jgi:photosystem II stability/assembly factor-like uncharacterized protein
MRMRSPLSVLALLALPACSGATCASPEASSTSTPSAALTTVKAPGDAEAVVKTDQPRRAIYSSRDSGQTWTPVDGGLPGDLEVTFMDPWGMRLVIGTEDHGLFIGDPTRQDWAQAGSGLPGVKITAIHVAEPDLYVGVYKQGIFASHDGGRTWDSLNRGLDDLRVRAILKVGAELVVGTDTGIFNSHDGQSTWQRVFAEAQVVSLNREGRKIVGGASSGTVLSQDDGEHWSWIQKKGSAHNTALIDGRIVLMNKSGDLYLSADWGGSWNAMSYGPREGWYVYEVVGAGNQLMACNNYGIHRSDDGGKRWQHVYKTEEWVFMDLVTLNGVTYGGTKGGKDPRRKSN